MLQPALLEKNHIRKLYPRFPYLAFLVFFSNVNILCTDGLSNVGLGALDDPNKLQEATEFYRVSLHCSFSIG